MDILAGAQALEQARHLARTAPYLTVTTWPPSPDRTQKAQIIALATPKAALVIDAGRTPDFKAFIGATKLLGASHAQRTAHALHATFGALPGRWACARLSHGLLTGDLVQTEQEWAAMAQTYGAAAPPSDSSQAMAHFAAQAQAWAHVLDAQAQALSQAHLTRVSRIEASAVNPIVMMESHGLGCDADRWRACVAHEQQQIVDLTQALAEALATPLTQASTEADLLAALAAHGHVRSALGHKSTQTLPKKLADILGPLMLLRRQALSLGPSFLRHVGPDGRIHAHFVQLGARTGRMACTQPNLQAITTDPARRSCFRAAPGHLLVMGDYAACELRILAEMSGDEAFMTAFAEGVDVHAQIATRLFATPVSRTVRPELRQMAKTISFGLIYGMAEEGLGQALGVTPKQAASLMAQFFAAYPKVQHHLQQSAQAGVARGYAQSLSGRRLALPKNPQPTQATLRLARNMPIQGTSADITKIALAALHTALLGQTSIKLVHCVHDEIVLECPVDALPQAQALLTRTMVEAGAVLLHKVALAVTVQHATSWQAH